MSTESLKKAFDPTINFTVFGSWVNTIETLETEADKNCQAYLLFKAIANYSMYGESPDFGDSITLRAVWPLIEREADNSLRRRRSNFAKDTINESYKRIIATFVDHPDYSYSVVAERTGTTKSMVARVRRKFASTIEAATHNRIAGNDGSSVVGTDTGTGTLGQPDTEQRHADSGCDPFAELGDDDGELPF